MIKAAPLAGSTSGRDAPPDMESFSAADPDWRVVLAGVALSLLLGLTFLRVGYWLGHTWNHKTSYYPHGVLVPFVCVYLLWIDRERLARLPRRVDPKGLIALALSLLLLWVGLASFSITLQGSALLGALFSVALTFHGWARLRATWFVWVYALLFMIPIPDVIVSDLTLDMRLWAASWTYAAVDALGLPAVLIGDSIHFPAGAVQVQDVCSGLRSVLTLLALAFLFARLQPVRWKAAAMLVFAIPIALLANAARIFALCLFAANGYPEYAAEGPVHEATGILVYAVAAILLYGIHALPGKAPEPAPRLPVETREANAQPISNGILRGLVLIALFGFAATTAHRVGRRSWASVTRPAETHVTASIPKRLASWVGEDVGDRGQLTRILKMDFLLRQYRHQGPYYVELFVLHRADGSGIHGPRGCYLIQGFAETSRKTSTLTTPSGPLVATRVVISQGRMQHLVYYWHRLDREHIGGRYALVGNRMSFLPRSFLNLSPPKDGATIRISTPIDTLEAAEARIGAFATDALDTVLAPLP